MEPDCLHSKLITTELEREREWDLEREREREKERERTLPMSEDEEGSVRPSTATGSPTKSVMSLQLQNSPAAGQLTSASRGNTLSLCSGSFPGPDSPSRKRYHTAPRDKHRVSEDLLKTINELFYIDYFILLLRVQPFAWRFKN